MEPEYTFNNGDKPRRIPIDFNERVGAWLRTGMIDPHPSVGDKVVLYDDDEGSDAEVDAFVIEVRTGQVPSILYEADWDSVRRPKK